MVDHVEYGVEVFKLPEGRADHADESLVLGVQLFGRIEKLLFLFTLTLQNK